MPSRPLARSVLPLALSCAAVPLAAQTPAPVVVEETGECTLGEPVMQVLRDEHGRPFYVEPESLVPGTDGELLLLGTPTYVWEEVDSTFREVARNEHTGALIREGTGALLAVPEGVEAPVGFRGVQLRSGRWGAVFASDSVGRYARGRMWYAETDGRGWGAPVQVPLPEGLPAEPFYTSGLVETPAGPAVVALLLSPGVNQLVAYVTGDGPAWRGEIVGETPVGSVALVGRGDEWPIIVVAGPVDPDRDRGLTVLGLSDSWSTLHQVHVPAPNLFGEHVAFTTGSDSYVSWRAPLAGGDDRYLWTARLGGSGRVEEVLPLSETEPWTAFAHGDLPVWIAVTRSGTHPLGELRVLTRREGRTLLVGSIPNPFLGPFGAASLGGDRVVLIGPDFRDHPTHQAVVSLRVDLTLSCR